jgi:oligopeptide/dipeptide ABC transporter ATP-binding protein
VDRVLVMLKGYVVEDAPIASMLEDPKHPYSQVLTGKVKINPAKKTARVSASRGCPFASFCPFVMKKCIEKMPPLIALDDRRRVACYLYGD